MTIYIPEKTQSFQKDLSNFGLRFQKFFPYSGDNFKTEGSVEQLAQNWKNTNKKDISRQLKQKHDRQDELLKQRFKLAAKILKIGATLSTRLITGIGETTPAEVGMVFDRNLGIPYIPASSIKGAVAYAYAVNAVNRKNQTDEESDTIFSTNESGFTALFGSRNSSDSSKGGFCFLDAYPINAPLIEVDIMNPHFSGYYQGSKPPSETDNPTPIKFLAVEKGTAFEFRGFFLKKEAEQYKDLLVEAFQTTLEMTGIGAKTAVGYGLFESFSVKDTIEQTVHNEIEKERRAREEKERREQEIKHLEALKAKEAEAARKKEREEKEYQKKLDAAEGIEQDILLLEKGNLEKAYQCYEKYFKNKKTLSGPEEIKLAELVSIYFEAIPKVTGKKAKKDKKGAEKYEKKCLVQKLLASSTRP
jgi:CRISPR type III-B/RAMP module RAMP protein Cmr6